MNQFKRAQVVMLPTKNELKGIYLNPVPSINKIHLWNKRISNSYIAQHLYIILDDEIKEDDQCLNLETNIVFIMHKHGLPTSNRNKKIIATTDTSLNKKHDCDCGATTYEGCSQCLEILPQPSQQFIEKYIEEYNKGNIIKDVLVEQLRGSDGYYDENDKCHWKILGLKINPKDNTITIKKLKDSYTYEEISKKFHEFADYIIPNTKEDHIQYDKWLKENL